MANNFDLNTENDDKQKENWITIEYNNKKCKRPPELLNLEDFYTIYSPKKFKLEPRDSFVLNLYFNITSKSKKIDPWISILPTLKQLGLTLLSKTVNGNKELEVLLQNQSYYYTVEVKKDQVLEFIFLLGLDPKKDFVRTEYICNYS